MQRRYLEVIAKQYGHSLADFGVEADNVARGARDLSDALKQFNPLIDSDRFVAATLKAYASAGGAVAVPARRSA